MYLIKLIKSNQVIIIMLYVYVYVVYFVMYDSVLTLLLSYGHHDWFNKVFLFLFNHHNIYIVQNKSFIDKIQVPFYKELWETI